MIVSNILVGGFFGLFVFKKRSTFFLQRIMRFHVRDATTVDSRHHRQRMHLFQSGHQSFSETLGRFQCKRRKHDVDGTIYFDKYGGRIVAQTVLLFLDAFPEISAFIFTFLRREGKSSATRFGTYVGRVGRSIHQPEGRETLFGGRFSN